MQQSDFIGSSADPAIPAVIDDDDSLITLDVPLSESEYARFKVLADQCGLSVDTLVESLVREQLEARP